jgi:hypothetical protein
MELLIALLLQFGISFGNNGGDFTIKWNDELATKKLLSSSEYKEYLANGGNSLLDQAGIPACNVTVMDWIKK